MFFIFILMQWVEMGVGCFDFMFINLIFWDWFLGNIFLLNVLQVALFFEMVQVIFFGNKIQVLS